MRVKENSPARTFAQWCLHPPLPRIRHAHQPCAPSGQARPVTTGCRATAAVGLRLQQALRPTSGFTPPLIGMVGEPHRCAQSLPKLVLIDTLVLDFPPHPNGICVVCTPQYGGINRPQPDGSYGPITDVLADLMLEKLYGSQVRTPAPDIWPGGRRIHKTITMSLIATDPTITIHYT